LAFNQSLLYVEYLHSVMTQTVFVFFFNEFLQSYKERPLKQFTFAIYMVLGLKGLQLIWIRIKCKVKHRGCETIDAYVIVTILEYVGLGQYLRGIDPQHRPIGWQLQGILIFRQIHFFQNITECVGKQRQGHDIWDRMASILNAPSRAEYYEMLERMICKCLENDWQPSFRNHSIL
jgi:hypothetical protein